MVLQNKYKARASRRHDEGEEDGGSGEGEEEEQATDDEQEVELNPAFPSLKNGLRHTSHKAEHVTKTTANQTADGEQSTGGIPSHQSTGLETSATEEASESEPEVDISNLLARVSALGEDAPVQGFAAGDTRADGNVTGQIHEDFNVQKDTDQSLAYLHARQQTRDARTRSAMKRADESFRKDRASGADNEMEKAEAVTSLKERFRGHKVGERREAAATRTSASSAAKGGEVRASRAHSQHPEDRRLNGPALALQRSTNTDDLDALLGISSPLRSFSATSRSPARPPSPSASSAALLSMDGAASRGPTSEVTLTALEREKRRAQEAEQRRAKGEAALQEALQNMGIKNTGHASQGKGDARKAETSRAKTTALDSHQEFLDEMLG
ncbi:hypothetical protein CBOM_07241 [Ceraceosorus bombacis]|uniref:Uncharacterized protein n=1 Tax=Ceraceosorus bombacis TaxID=401625 RepID=A0A0P1B956_9BASI|nr:hypothetical protein CBOM_07241 [Ceraceosorus bombacis]